ncbi:histidine acid phosphatase [Tritrichomonas foetus]|uniref:Histidine acid phosphatase n=1 Tax=Tritrichomonas foetus TaxID=1144522 RepID=A0A1J4K6U2_9EUKA|nr:histidine acid phosphatase [Tritrichomonas foetus]|eukprot:OHT06690.1 histidine acid phosphatase [Tritrichomonas foetus]
MMLLFCLSYLIKSYSLQCSSPLKHAEPVKNAKLVSFALYLRHGMRTPLMPYTNRTYIGQWICDSESAYAPRNHFSVHKDGISRRYFNQLDRTLVEFPPNCQTGDLLLQGMEQHHELGEFYRNYLVEELHFLPKLVHPELMKLRSSFVERTFRSAESFLAGFYPPVTPGERLSIITGTDSSDFLYPDAYFCSDLMKDWEKFTSSEKFIERREKARVLYKDLYNRLNLTFDGENWLYIGDYLNTMTCTNQELPDFVKEVVTDELFEQTQKDIAYYSYGHYSIRRGVGASAILRDLFNNIDAQLEGKAEERFFLYSAHDSTLASILSAFGIYSEELPTYRSHLAFEIWENEANDKGGSKEKYVRVVFNGEPIVLDQENKNVFVKYSDLKLELAQAGVLDYCRKEYDF